MLTSAERRQVQDALQLQLMMHADHRQLVPVIFPKFQDILRQLPTVAGTDVDADRIVSVCVVDRWRQDPALLQQLLQYLVVNQGQGALASLLERVTKKEDPNPSAFDPVWLTSSQQPFFDRVDLRLRLLDMIEASQGPILLVQGPKDSFGKSYTCELIEHVAVQSGGVTNAVHVALSPKTGPTYDVEDLALDLLKCIGIKEAPAHTDSNYGQAVARAVLNALVDAGGQWVIVLDGFAGATKDVQEAIGNIAALIPSDQYRPTLRLVLIGYPSSLLPQSISAANILSETLKPAGQIANLDLQPVVVEIEKVRVTEGKTALAATDVPLVVDRMLLDAPAKGKARLKSLNTALSRFRSYTE
jgi:hypothetical protein